jgi:hypothetical protein
MIKGEERNKEDGKKYREKWNKKAKKEALIILTNQKNGKWVENKLTKTFWKKMKIKNLLSFFKERREKVG